MSEEELAAIIEQYLWLAAGTDTALTSKETEKRIRHLVEMAVKQITEGME